MEHKQLIKYTKMLKQVFKVEQLFFKSSEKSEKLLTELLPGVESRQLAVKYKTQSIIELKKLQKYYIGWKKPNEQGGNDSVKTRRYRS